MPFLAPFIQFGLGAQGMVCLTFNWYKFLFSSVKPLGKALERLTRSVSLR